MVAQRFGRQKIPCEVRFSRLPAGDRKLIRVSITDITKRKLDDEFTYAQNKILEMVAASMPFDRTLRSICRCIEKIDSGMRAAVMQLQIKTQMLHLEQAPSLSSRISNIACGARMAARSWCWKTRVLCSMMMASSSPHEGTLTDITERKQAETRVFKEKERAQVTLQSIGDGVITTDAEGQIDYLNPVAQNLTGWGVRGARGKPVKEIMTIINEHTRATVANPVMRCLKEGRVITLADNSVLINHEGAEIPIQDSAAPIRDRIGNLIGAVMVFHDVSKESRLFRQLSHQASHDALTGLINRQEFENRVVSALENSQEHPTHTHALLYIDLDQFKVVNDKHKKTTVPHGAFFASHASRECKPFSL